MDPRPYHFEYRRPRLTNPTFESSHLYGSIYQLKMDSHDNRNPQKNNRSLNESIKRAHSTDLNTKKHQISISDYRYKPANDCANENLRRSAGIGMNTGGGDQAPEPRKESSTGNSSKLASYGSQLMRGMDQREVYEKQEKQFNIISFYPRRYRPNLKQFPKLTLEDKLIENQ